MMDTTETTGYVYVKYENGALCWRREGETSWSGVDAAEMNFDDATEVRVDVQGELDIYYTVGDAGDPGGSSFTRLPVTVKSPEGIEITFSYIAPGTPTRCQVTGWISTGYVNGGGSKWAGPAHPE